ncbi:hypothetical protein BSLG_000576 [Batrachochytrium salamandrivorans]|nr:hypothetical protein BSLG_000576 [Batrachochytrium salamandrivorans]
MSEFPDGDNQQEEDWVALALDDRLAHKSWKARQSAYDELAKQFRLAESGDAPIFQQYQETTRAMLSDANQIALDSGLSAVLEYVRIANIAVRAKSVITPLVVDKCLPSSRGSTKAKAIDTLLMLIEIDNADVVVECLIAGLDHKTPKNVAACVTALRNVVTAYGIPVVPVKPIVKALPKLFDHRDKTVRSEGTSLVLEIYRWVGQNLLSSLSDLKPVQIKDITALCTQDTSGRPQATRLRRSDALKATPARADTPGMYTAGFDVSAPAEEILDLDFSEPVNILDKLPKTFYTNLLSPKWKERKEALDELLVTLTTPKIEDGRYSELVNALAKKLPDPNVTVAVVAAQCIAQLAKGLKSAFSQYRNIVIGPVLERMKEKKKHVLDALKSALDAISSTVNSVIDMMDDIVFGMTHKNPQIKLESVQWLVRCLILSKKSKKRDITRTNAKPILDTLLKGIDDGLESVRDASAEALGYMMVFLTEQAMAAHLDRLDKVKQARIKEYYTIAMSNGAGGASSAPAALNKSSAQPLAEIQARSLPQQIPRDKENQAPKATSKSSTASSAAPKRKVISSSAATAPSSNVKTVTDEPIRFTFSDESAEAAVCEWIGDSIAADLSSSTWKIRLAGIQSITEMIGDTEPTVSSEAIIRFLCKKPGWKDNNFQVMAGMISIFKTLAKLESFTKGTASLIIPGCVDKMSDIKAKKVAGECLGCCVERTSLVFVLSQIYEPAKKLKSPKAIADVLVWMSDTIVEFTTAGVNVKGLVEFVKSNLGNSNAAVRLAAVSVLVNIFRCVGSDIKGLLQDVTPQIMTTIEAEFEKVADSPRIVPSKFQANVPVVAATDDIIPRVDLNTRISSSMMEQMSNPNWKERKLAMDELSETIKGTQMKIQSLLSSDLISALKQRLSDSNKNLAMSATDICGMLSIAMGKPFEKYVRIFLPGVLAQLVDQKTLVRAMVTSTLDRFSDTMGLGPLFANISTSLKTDQPLLRKDLLKWLCERLPTESVGASADANIFVQSVLQCVQDRNQDVRKGAQSVLVHIVRDIGAEEVRQYASDTFSGSTLSSLISQIDSAVAEVGSSGGSGSKALSNNKSRDLLPQGKAAAPAKRPLVVAATGGSDGTPYNDENIPSARSSSSSISLGGDQKSSKIGAPAPKGRVIRPGSLVLKKEAAASESSDQSTTPLIPTDARAKDARAAADKGMHKWAFETPRRDLLEFLSEQCQPCMSPDLHALLFSTDHYKEKDFLSGLKMLDMYAIQSLEGRGADAEHGRALFSFNSDVLFKYLTIRFYDTNTSILLKSLELLEHMLSIYDMSGLLLSEYEATSFLPHLIAKVGDPKETLRVRVRSIMKMISRVYPASRFVQYLLKSLDSKNSRTRSECLEELSSLIQRNGLTAFTPAKALPVIASQISDRDAAVRNSALNALCQTYTLIGDDMYTYLGRLSEKDKDMLGERLKRLPPPVMAVEVSHPVSNQTSAASGGRRLPLQPSSSLGHDSSASNQRHDRSGPSDRQAFETGTPKQVPFRDITENQSVSSHLNSARNKLTGGASPSAHYTALADPSHQPTPSSGVPKEFTLDFETMEVRSVKSQSSLNDNQDRVYSKPSVDRLLPESERIDLMIDVMITHVTSLDVSQSIDGLKQLEKLIMTTPDVAKPRINDIVSAATLQLRIAFTNLGPQEANIARLVKHVSSLLVHTFSSDVFSKLVSTNILEQCVQEVLLRLIDPTLQTIDPSNVLGRALNILMIRVIESCDCNVTFRVLLRILQRSAAACSNLTGQVLALHSKHTELVMKCVWKVTKMLPKRLEDKTINISDILTDIHDFLSLAPPTYWKKRVADNVIPQADMPLRTVKTILHELVNTLGKDVRKYADGITAESHVQIYLDQMLGNVDRRSSRLSNTSRDLDPLKRLSQDMSGPTSPRDSTSGGTPSAMRQQSQGTAAPSSYLGNAARGLASDPLKSPSVYNRTADERPSLVDSESNEQDTLAQSINEIFAMISDKEQTKQGVQKLYHFQLKHPDANHLVEQRISLASNYFQGYIRRGLTAFAQASAAEAVAVNAAATAAAMNALGGAGDKRLEGYQRQMGIAHHDSHGVAALGAESSAVGGSADSFRETLTRLQVMFGNSSAVAPTPAVASTRAVRPASYVDPPSSAYEKLTRHRMSSTATYDVPGTSSATNLGVASTAVADRQQRSQAVGDLKERLARMKLAMEK